MEEALRAALREVTARPIPHLVEVVQFLVLVGVIGWAARGPLTRRLAERRQKIATALAETELAERECVTLGDEARAATIKADGDAPGIIAAAREQALKDEAAAVALAEAEAEQAIRLARETVEREKARVAAEACERLVKLTTEVARRYLDDFVGEGERRLMTEKALLESLDEMEHGPLPRTPE